MPKSRVFQVVIAVLASLIMVASFGTPAQAAARTACA